MTENTKCVKCSTAEGLSEVRDAKGAWPIGFAGTWCDPCLQKAMEKELGVPLPSQPAMLVKAMCNGQPVPVIVGTTPGTAKLHEPPRCVACGGLEIVHHINDKKGGPEQGGLQGDWCDDCFTDAYQAALPKCDRCGTRNELTKSKDAKGTLEGFFCPYCTRFLMQMELWSETNWKAATYLAAFRRTKAMLGGSLVAVQQVADEVRRIVA
jgi:hypothetical protein